MPTWDFDTSGEVRLDLEIPFGRVEIETAAGETTHVSLEGNETYSRELIESARVESHQRGERSDVVVEVRSRGFMFSIGRSPEIRLRIVCPPGADVTIIPFRTTPDLITALLRGDVDAGFDYYAGFEGSLSGGRLRIIATSGEARDVLLKDVPTSAESGFPQYVATSWNGLTTRAGAPAEVIRVLNAELNRALTNSDVQQRLRGLGLEGRGSTPDEMRARLTNDIAKWRDVINKAGIPKQ